MTWDELNEKYPEARDEMSEDRERDFFLYKKEERRTTKK